VGGTIELKERWFGELLDIDAGEFIWEDFLKEDFLSSSGCCVPLTGASSWLE